MAVRTLAGMGLRAFYNLGENGWKDSMDEDLRKLSIFVMPVVFSRVTELPDTPTPGDRHILETEDSNSGAAGSIILWDGEPGLEEWVYFAPSEGWEVWSIADNAKYRYTGGVWNGISGAGLAAEDISYDGLDGGDSNSEFGDVRVALDELFRRARQAPRPALYIQGAGSDENRTFTYVFTQAMRYGDLSACKAVALTPGEDSNSAATVIDIRHDNVLFAQLTFAQGSGAGVFSYVGDSNSGDEVFAIGDTMTFVCPADFNFMARIAITMHGEVVG